jgi:hypothetical protein
MNFDTSADTQKKYGMSEKDVEKIEKIKSYIIKNYGTNEHQAAIEMCKELDLDAKSLEIVEFIGWYHLPNMLKENKINTLIAIYCDMRIGPQGILKLRGRFDDSLVRARGKYEKYYEDAQSLEKLIQADTNVDINKITDEDLNSLFPEIINLKV